MWVTVLAKQRAQNHRKPLCEAVCPHIITNATTVIPLQNLWYEEGGAEDFYAGAFENCGCPAAAQGIYDGEDDE
jgi:hypothetical protein